MRIFISFLFLLAMSACAQTGSTDFTMNEKTIDEFFEGRGEPDNPLIMPNTETGQPDNWNSKKAEVRGK